jgi:hypothetical protein
MTKPSCPVPVFGSLPTILSIDLGIRPESIGACQLHGGRVTFPVIDQTCHQMLALYQGCWQQADGGDAAAATAAVALAQFIVQRQPDMVVIDGPQGFARPGFKRRRAEAILRTSGYTGECCEAPKRGFSWPGIARLGIKVFDALSLRGFARLTEPAVQAKGALLEVFPDACWHSFGLEQETLASLQTVFVGNSFTWTGDPDEHDLDAAVGVLTAVTCLQGHAVFVGHPFFDGHGVPREGYIVIPDPGRAWAMDHQLYRAAVDEAGHAIYARRHDIDMRLVTIDPQEAPQGDVTTGGHTMPDSSTIKTLTDRIKYMVAGVAALRAMQVGTTDDTHQPDIADAVAAALPHITGHSESHVRAWVLNVLDEVAAEFDSPENKEAIRRCAEHLMIHKTIKGANVNDELDSFLS